MPKDHGFDSNVGAIRVVASWSRRLYTERLLPGREMWPRPLVLALSKHFTKIELRIEVQHITKYFSQGHKIGILHS